MARERGSGSISDLGKGSYKLRLFAGRDPVTGNKRQLSRTVKCRNITEARHALKAFADEQVDEQLGTHATVRTLMADWLKQLGSDGKSPRTIAEASRTVDRLINPTLGDVRLSDLTSRDIDVMNRKTAGLAPASRRRYHAVLAAALEQAVKWGWLSHNPARQANVPKLVDEGLTLPTRAEVTTLIEAMPSEVWAMALRLAVFTGARRGELCALRWSDIRDSKLHIRRSVYRLKGQTVEKTTKGGRERIVPVGIALAELLRSWQDLTLDRAKEADVNVPEDAFVLSTWPDSSVPLNPDTLSAHVRRASKDTGLDHVHLHSIRHFAVSEMLAAGIPVRDVAEIVGHNDGGRLVLRVYGHATSERQIEAAEVMAKALTAG